MLVYASGDFWLLRTTAGGCWLEVSGDFWLLATTAGAPGLPGVPVAPEAPLLARPPVVPVAHGKAVPPELQVPGVRRHLLDFF